MLMAETTDSEKKRTLSLHRRLILIAGVCGIAFFHLGAVGVLAASVPFYVFKVVEYLQFFSNHGAIALSLQAAGVSVGQAIGSALFGWFSDVFGRRKLLVTVCILQIGGYLLITIQGGFGFFLFARLCNGLFVGIIPILLAVVSDLTFTVRERTIYTGLVGAFLDFGMMGGSTIGLVICDQPFAILGYVSAIFSFISLLLILAILMETNPSCGSASTTFSSWRYHVATPTIHKAGYGTCRPLENAAEEGSVMRQTKSDIISSTKQEDDDNDNGSQTKTAWCWRRIPHHILWTLTAYFFLVLGYAAQQTLFVALAKEKFDMHVNSHYIIFIIVGGCMFFAQVFLVRGLFWLMRLKTLSIIAGLTVSFGLMGLILAPTFDSLVAILCIMAIGYSICTISIQSTISIFSFRNSRGLSLGVGETLASTARVLGPLLAGALYQVNPVAPFVSAAIFAIIAVACLTRLRNVKSIDEC